MFYFSDHRLLATTHDFIATRIVHI